MCGIPLSCCFHSLMGLLSCISHFLLPSHCLNSSVYFLLYLLNFASTSSRVLAAARGPTLWSPFYDSTRDLFSLPINAGLEGARGPPSNIAESIRKTAITGEARARRLSKQTPPRCARARPRKEFEAARAVDVTVVTCYCRESNRNSHMY